jgi:regulatory factor X
MNPSQGRVFAEPYSQALHASQSRTASDYVYDLQFPTEDLLASPDDLTITLPSIHPYLPAKFDEDAADALVALYRSHCTSLVDAVRFCKEKQFFKLFTSFHGTLTVPVQKLFAMREISPWIRECDWMMYQKMVRNVSQLTLQVAPPAVLKFLDNIGKMLHGHISVTFAALPLHVLEAKLEPATLFAHLLRQMLRVNSTAHAAAVALTVDNQRETMWNDWQAYVKIKRVMENVLPQSCALETVFHILAHEIRDLLIPAWSNEGSLYPTPEETVIDRISAFLTKLPSRFPNANTRAILLCINAVGSAALREITVENGVSFQGWWLTKVFIDEYAHWLASLGGFLVHSPPNPDSSTASPDIEEGTNVELDITNGVTGSSNGNNDSRFSSLGADNGAQVPGAEFPGSAQGTGNSGSHAGELFSISLLTMQWTNII